MKKLKYLVSAGLLIAMLIGMFVFPVTASIVPDGVTTVEELLATFGEENYSVYDLGDGSITYDGTACLKMTKGSGTVTATNDTADNGPRKDYTYRTDINPSEEDYKSESNLAYCVINYASCSSVAHELFIWCPKLQGAAAADSRVVTIAEVGAGDTGWTASSVITITAGLKERIKGTNSFTVASTKANSDVYISSIVFFANEEDAAKYAELAPVLMNPDAVAKAERLEKREENWETIKLIMMLIGTSIGERMDAKPVIPPRPFSGIDSNLYSVVEFTADNIVAGIGTAKATVDSYADTACAKMVAYDWTMSNFFEYGDAGYTTHYNVSIKPGSSEFSADDLVYCVVNYASVSDQEHTLWFWAPNLHGSNSKRGLEIAKVPAGITGWQNSPVIEIPAGMKARLTQPNNVTLASDAQSGSTAVYVSSLIFFETEEAANQYLEQYENYYAENKPEIIAGDPLKALQSSGKGSVLPVVFDGDAFVLSDGSNSVITANYPYGERNVGGVKINYRSNSMTMDSLGANYCVAVSSHGNDTATAFYNAFISKDYKYAVITYATDADESAYLGVFRWGDVATGRHNVVADDISVSDGEWVTTGVVEIGDKWKSRISGKGKLYVFSPLTDNDASLYIREIVYFTNEDDAKYYADNAPKFYNESFGYFTNPADSLKKSGKGAVLPMVLDGEKYVALSDTANSVVAANYQYGERGVGSVKLNYKSNAMNMDSVGANFSVALGGDNNNSNNVYNAFCTDFSAGDYKYAVITYATDADRSAYLGVFRWGDAATGRHTVVTDDISVSDGKWVTTGVVEIGDKWKSRISGKGKTYVFSPLADTEASLYIREVVYFENADDAKYYADNAPEFYNAKYGYFN